MRSGGKGERYVKGRVREGTLIVVKEAKVWETRGGLCAKEQGQDSTVGLGHSPAYLDAQERT